MNTIEVHSKKELLNVITALDYSTENVIHCGKMTYTLPPQLTTYLAVASKFRINSIESAAEYRRKRLLTAIRKIPASAFQV